MKLGLISDIHAHRHDQREDVDALIAHINGRPVPDLLVLAGDISHRTKEIRSFLARIELPCTKCWVPGNHDIWVIDPESNDDTSESRYSITFPGISESVGWHYLPKSPLLLLGADVAIVGCIGWFTGTGYSEWFDSESGPEDRGLARRFAEDIRTQVEGLPKSTRLIVVTHHLSHSSAPSHDPTQGNTWSKHLEALIEANAPRILAVVHGHRHVRYDPVKIDGMLFAAHPFGYPHQHSGVEDGYREVSIGH